ncbi:GNAT family N-acetyltransferase [Brevibacillus ginsengisoli]|uniref:GNAT family N-acetyltransferase n=1 Tax=Brevibacillus ginsengisoli TaxID=363854 RepID=UPI003CEC7C75
MIHLPINEHLSLKLPEPGDAPQLFARIDESREHLSKYLPWVEMTKNLHHTESYIDYLRSQFEAKRVCKFSILCDEEIVGEVGYGFINAKDRSASLSFWLASKWEGQGIATQSARAMIQYGFTELGLNRVEIHCAIDNERAQQVAKRLGFVEEGRLRQGECRYDEFVDVFLFGMLKDEWTFNS